jgi:Tol biopolymer transport system component
MPDGRAIAYTDTNAPTNIWTVPVSGGAPSQLTRFGDRAIVDFDWSPDGKRLVVARMLETNDIVVLKGLRRN